MQNPSSSNVNKERVQLPVGKRVVVFEYGENQVDAIEHCLRHEIQQPPLLSELDEGDIVVAVKAAEVVWTDTIMATGQYQHQAKLPYSPGMTYSGIVAFVTEGARKKGMVVGQKVAIAGGNAGPRSLGKYQKWGGCATYAVAPVSAVRKIPTSWSMDEAACFAYGYDTVHYCLVECGKLQSGETILINGATGGVGIPAVRMAKALGAIVIATTRSSKKVKFLKDIGADHVVIIGDGKGGIKKFRTDVKQLTPDGRGVDVAYDGVGGDAITVESMRCCRFGARFLIVGWAATPNVAKGKGKRGAPNVNRIPTNYIMMKGLHIIGCPAAISLKFDRNLAQRRIHDIEKWIHDGSLPPPVIACAYSLEDIQDALKTRIRSGAVLGSTVVRPTQVCIDNAKL